MDNHTKADGSTQTTSSTDNLSMTDSKKNTKGSRFELDFFEFCNGFSDGRFENFGFVQKNDDDDTGKELGWEVSVFVVKEDIYMGAWGKNMKKAFIELIKFLKKEGCFYE